MWIQPKWESMEIFPHTKKGIDGDSGPYLDAHIMGDIYQTPTLIALSYTTYNNVASCS
jgi:hypothetical protein